MGQHSGTPIPPSGHFPMIDCRILGENIKEETVIKNEDMARKLVVTSLITVVLYFIWNNNNTPENYQMREVSSLSLTSGHDDSHPGVVLAEERSAMVLNPAMVWSINSYLGYRHCHKELLLFYSLFCTGIQGEDRVSRIWWVVNAATTLHLEHWHWPRLHFLYTRTCRIHRLIRTIYNDKNYCHCGKSNRNVDEG